MIVDTCFIIDFMQNDVGAIMKFDELQARREPLRVTTVNLFELYTGTAQYHSPEQEKQKIASFLRGQHIILLEPEAAQRGGEINGTLISQGNQIGPFDCLHAGIALIKNEQLLTRNIKHFSRIKELKTEPY